jgi:hypothetical protein
MKDTREMNDERTLVDDSGVDKEQTIPTISRDDGNRKETNVGLLSESDLRSFRERWDEVQAGFVDDPKTAVENADRLVDQTMRRLTETFTQERGNLEASWSRGEQASTEDLRLALQRYRSFFNRLLSA